MKGSLASVAATLALMGVVACAASQGSDADANDPGSGDAGSIDLNQPSKKDAGKATTTRPLDDGGVAVGGDEEPTPSGIGGGPRQPMRFATKVVSFTPGACAGFGQASMPQIVLGPPKGAGDSNQGSLDVVSLGKGGEIVLSFEPSVIVDGPGIDFVVYENAFYVAGDPTQPYAEPAEVSVSEDGVTWHAFPCLVSQPPYGSCAGWHPVYATDEATANDVAKGGGDPYDLAQIGVARARFVKIKDKTSQRCTSQGPDTNGFDLDAIGAVHTQVP